MEKIDRHDEDSGDEQDILDQLEEGVAPGSNRETPIPEKSSMEDDSTPGSTDSYGEKMKLQDSEPRFKILM